MSLVKQAKAFKEGICREFQYFLDSELLIVAFHCLTCTGTCICFGAKYYWSHLPVKDSCKSSEVILENVYEQKN